MVHKHCCYGTCRSDSRYSEKEFMKNVTFVAFPKPKTQREKCERWIKACARENFHIENVNKYTYICSLHFVGQTGPTSDHPDPVPGNYCREQVQRFRRKRKAPSHRASTFTKTSRVDKLDAAEALLMLSTAPVGLPTETTRESCTQTDFLCKESVCTSLSIKSLRAKVQSLEMALKVEKAKHSFRRRVVMENMENSLSVNSLKNDPRKFYFYTGLQLDQFYCLWNFLGKAASKLSLWGTDKTKSKTRSPTKLSMKKRKLEPMDQLLLVLMRLRLGLAVQDLAYRFVIGKATASRIVITWIQFLYKHFRALKSDMFATREVVRKHLPKAFKSIKNIRTIIDCTEIFVQQPRDFAKQGNMYSSYKSHATYKILIGVAPTGAVMFVSDCFEGSISDREIVLQSGFLSYINEGDLVLADRGFKIKDLLASRKAYINIPPFLGKRKRLTPQEEMMTKRLARHRIHVERAIERMKKFKILKNVVPLSLSSVMSQIVFVVGCLVNFQKPIVT